MKVPRSLALVPNGQACLFKDCPPGLFMFEGRIGIRMKTGYGYIEPGEMFLGADPYPHLPDQCAVQPVKHKWDRCESMGECDAD